MPRFPLGLATFTVASLALATFPFASAARGQDTNAVASKRDRIWIEPARPTKTESRWYPRSIITRSGKLIDLGGKQTRFLVEGDEAETLLPSDRVIWIEPGQRSEKETAALRLFAAGKHGEAVEPLLDVLTERPPVWRQQWLSMLAGHAAWKSGRAAIALEIVSHLDRRPLPAMVLASLPIEWKNGRVEATNVTAAGARLDDPSPAVRLVAASWLLSSGQRNEASATLQALSKNERSTVARLAETLLWRTASPRQVSEAASSWRTKIEALPIALQTGPIKTLADKLRAADLSDQADLLLWSLDLTPAHPKLEP